MDGERDGEGKVKHFSLRQKSTAFFLSIDRNPVTRGINHIARRETPDLPSAHHRVAEKLDRTGSGRSPSLLYLASPFSLSLLSSLKLTGSNHAVDDHVPLLPDAVGSVDGLHVVGGVPGRVEQDDAVRPG